MKKKNKIFAKVTMIFQDKEDGTVYVQIESDPDFSRSHKRRTKAQQLALIATQHAMNIMGEGNTTDNVQ